MMDISQLAIALTIARDLDEEYRKVNLLTALARYLPAELLDRAQTSIYSIHKNEARSQILEQIKQNQHLINRSGMEALEKKAEVNVTPERDLELEANDELREYLRERVMKAQTIQDSFERAALLVALAKHVSSTFVYEAFLVAREIWAVNVRANALAKLSPYLSENLVETAMEDVLDYGDKYESSFSIMAPHLSSKLIRLAWKKILEISEEEYRAQLFNALAAYASRDLLPEMLEETESFETYDAKAIALVALVPHLAEEEQQTVATEALNAVFLAEDVKEKARMLSAVAAYIPEKLLGEALTEARRCCSHGYTARAISAFVPRIIENSQKESIINEAYQYALQEDEDGYYIVALHNLIPYLSPELKIDLWNKSWDFSFDEPEHRFNFLRVLASNLPVAFLVDKFANDLVHGSVELLVALGEISDYLPTNERQKIFSDAREMAESNENPRIGVTSLGALVPFLSESEQIDLLPKILDSITHMKSINPSDRTLLLNNVVRAWTKVEFTGCTPILVNSVFRSLGAYPRDQLLNYLTSLLPLIQHFGAQSAIGETLFALRDVTRWWP